MFLCEIQTINTLCTHISLSKSYTLKKSDYVTPSGLRVKENTPSSEDQKCLFLFAFRQFIKVVHMHTLGIDSTIS